jgi:hypothetical protein
MEPKNAWYIRRERIFLFKRARCLKKASLKKIVEHVEMSQLLTLVSVMCVCVLYIHVYT